MTDAKSSPAFSSSCGLISPRETVVAAVRAAAIRIERPLHEGHALAAIERGAAADFLIGRGVAASFRIWQAPMMPPSLTSLATSRVVGERPRSKSSGKVATSAIISLFVRQSTKLRFGSFSSAVTRMSPPPGAFWLLKRSLAIPIAPVSCSFAARARDWLHRSHAQAQLTGGQYHARSSTITTTRGATVSPPAREPCRRWSWDPVLAQVAQNFRRSGQLLRVTAQTARARVCGARRQRSRWREHRRSAMSASAAIADDLLDLREGAEFRRRMRDTCATGGTCAPLHAGRSGPTLRTSVVASGTVPAVCQVPGLQLIAGRQFHRPAAVSGSAAGTNAAVFSGDAATATTAPIARCGTPIVAVHRHAQRSDSVITRTRARLDPDGDVASPIYGRRPARHQSAC